VGALSVDLHPKKANGESQHKEQQIDFVITVADRP